jgi:hypothetical protein
VRDLALENMARSMSARGVLSGERFFTVFVESSLLCVLVVKSADYSLEFSNFLKILGVLYPETRIFCSRQLSKCISLIKLASVMDNYTGCYPHKFVTMGESKDDCQFVNDHFHRVNRVMHKTPEDKVNNLWERSSSTYTPFSPGFESGFSSDSRVRNSAREIKEYWRTSAGIVLGVYKKFYDLYCRSTIMGKAKLKDACDLSPEKCRVVRFSLN